MRAAAARVQLDSVPSPTFTLAQRYELGAVPVTHFDLYRIVDTSEADELGLEEAIGEGIALVEWPERLGARLPADRLEIELSQGAHMNARTARIAGYGSWEGRIERLSEND
jgi:tRNA threonylcarbamoyladenosine biosynthesis protein TsaE